MQTTSVTRELVIELLVKSDASNATANLTVDRRELDSLRSSLPLSPSRSLSDCQRTPQRRREVRVDA